MASKTSLALVAVLSIGVPLSLAQAQTDRAHFPASILSPSKIWSSPTVSSRTKKFSTASAMSASAIPEIPIAI